MTFTRRKNQTSTLDCWRETQKFKASVAGLEQVRLAFPKRSPLILTVILTITGILQIITLES